MKLPQDITRQFAAKGSTWKFRHRGNTVFCDVVWLQNGKTYATGTGADELSAARDAVSKAKDAVKPRTPQEVAQDEAALKRKLEAATQRIKELESGAPPATTEEPAPGGDPPPPALLKADDIGKSVLRTLLENAQIPFERTAGVENLRKLAREHKIAE